MKQTIGILQLLLVFPDVCPVRIKQGCKKKKQPTDMYRDTFNVLPFWISIL